VKTTAPVQSTDTAAADTSGRDRAGPGEPTHRFANSPRLILARYLADVPSLVLGVIGTVLWVSIWVDPWRTLGYVLVGLGIFMIVAGPWLRLLTVRYAVSSQGLQQDVGLLFRRSEFLPWDLVNSMDDRQPWSHRLFRLTELTCSQTGEDGSRITLEALSPEDLARVQRFAAGAGVTGATDDGVSPAESAGTGPSTAPESVPAEEATERLIHRMTLVDLTLLCLIYGQVLVLVPPLAFGLMELAELVGLDRAMEDGLMAGLGSWTTMVLLVLAVLGTGIAATVLKYHDFTVHALPDGRMRIRYGLFSTHQRLIYPSAVQGVVWQRNAVEQLTGRVRLSVLTLDSSSQLGGNLLLPSLPRALAVRLVSQHLPRYRDSSALVSTRVRPLAWNLLAALLLAALVLATWTFTVSVLGWASGWALLGCLVVLLLGNRLGGVLGTRFSAAPGLFAARRLMLAERVTVVRAARLHGVTAVFGVFRDRRRPRAWLPTVHYFSGSPRRVTALTSSAKTLAGIQEMVRRESAGA
jgi:putative membrane protein